MTDCEIDLSTCGLQGEEFDCLVNTIAQNCKCPVLPTWEQFQATLNNPGIIANLEADGNYITVKAITRATAVEIDAVPGIGPVSVAAIETALEYYNLELTP